MATSKAHLWLDSMFTKRSFLNFEHENGKNGDCIKIRVRPFGAHAIHVKCKNETKMHAKEVNNDKKIHEMR